MFILGDKNDIHAILPTVFAFTNVLLGIIGYYVTYIKIRQLHLHSMKKGNNAGAASSLPMAYHKYWIHAYSCFCAILGMGYNRFMYPSDYVAWRAGVTFPLTAFFTSRILFTLLAMGVILIPGVSVVSTSFGAYIVRNHVNDPSLSWAQNISSLLDNGNILSRDSKWSPLLGFWVAETAVMFLVFLPIFFVPSVKATKKTLKTQ
ncbi:hypothetical protein BGZ58_006054 [Dissophora ornata]|nr:hypothetical protein BGZ58_006054 [Dissophora ornata]